MSLQIIVCAACSIQDLMASSLGVFLKLSMPRGRFMLFTCGLSCRMVAQAVALPVILLVMWSLPVVTSSLGLMIFFPGFSREKRRTCLPPAALPDRRGTVKV